MNTPRGHNDPDEPHQRGTQGAKKALFDNPRNVRWLVRGLTGLCILLFGLDALLERHAVHPWDGVFGFYPLYGFGACVLLVLLARELRKLVRRDADYYQDHHLHGDGTVPSAGQGAGKDSDRGTDKGADQGTDKGADKGADQGTDKGTDKGADQGTDKGADQGTDRDSDREPRHD